MAKTKTTKEKKALPKSYKAPKGSKREKELRKASALYKAGKKKEAFNLRENMEKKVRRSKSK